MKFIASSVGAFIDGTLTSEDGSICYKIRSLPSRIHKTVHVAKNDSLLAHIELHTLSPDILKLRDIAIAVEKECVRFVSGVLLS